MFERVGILGHPLRPATGEVCSAVASSLTARGVAAWCSPAWDAESIHRLVAESDLVIAIGGDGSMLRAARVCSEHNVPVFGINAGYLGFLTEASLADWDNLLSDLLSGQYWIEERMMIRAEAWHADALIASGDALNDVVIGRGAVAKSVLLDAFIDGDWTTQYNADGLIIATPTGSTAYALAVGGPILPPTLKNILVVPVAPHLTLDRPIVLAEGATIEVIIAERTATDVTLTLDGESLCSLVPSDSIIVYASEHVSRFVRLRERNYFYRSLLDRMEPRLSPRREGAPQPRRPDLEKKA
ncbi:MAG: NAD(+)/NADH kinase [Chloroflexi bacterium CFX4]|nr:NAD(+)/NADH kinase [Chloroflexi bacterium CFX4]MDL1921406.1 NAD(+)/NADH kinase [Chloroflexi bacterium CFX3]